MVKVWLLKARGLGFGTWRKPQELHRKFPTGLTGKNLLQSRITKYSEYKPISSQFLKRFIRIGVICGRGRGVRGFQL